MRSYRGSESESSRYETKATSTENRHQEKGIKKKKSQRQQQRTGLEVDGNLPSLEGFLEGVLSLLFGSVLLLGAVGDPRDKRLDIGPTRCVRFGILKGKEGWE
jgi:hypothetical protein